MSVYIPVFDREFGAMLAIVAERQAIVDASIHLLIRKAQSTNAMHQHVLHTANKRRLIGVRVGGDGVFFF